PKGPTARRRWPRGARSQAPAPSLAAPWVGTGFLELAHVVEHLAQLLVELLLRSTALELEIAHARELLFAQLPRFFGDADVGTKHDVAQPVANQLEVAHGYLSDHESPFG